MQQAAAVNNSIATHNLPPPLNEGVDLARQMPYGSTPSLRTTPALPAPSPFSGDEAVTPHRMPIPRAPPSHVTSPNSSRGRRRPQYFCPISTCPWAIDGFTRQADLTRHMDTKHSSFSSDRFRCLNWPCSHTCSRRDKMQEHCQRQHDQARGQEWFDDARSSDTLDADELMSSLSPWSAGTPGSSTGAYRF